jgi:hypothetical protein
MIGTDDICAAVFRDRQKGASVADLASLYREPETEIRRLLGVARSRYASFYSTVGGGLSDTGGPVSSSSSHNGYRRPGS